MIRFGRLGSVNDDVLRFAEVLDDDDFNVLPRLFRKAGRAWDFTFDGFLYHGTTRSRWADVQPGTQVLHVTADRHAATEYADGKDSILVRIPWKKLDGWALGPDENLMEEEGETDPLVSAAQVGHVVIVGDIEALKPSFEVLALGSSNRAHPATVKVLFDEYAFTVVAAVNGKQVGALMIRPRSISAVGGSCTSMMRRFAKEVGASSEQVLIVRGAEVQKPYQNQGIGERMYRLAARVAARRYGQLLGSDSVLWSGTTSPTARDVWVKLMGRFRHQSCDSHDSGFFVWGGR